MKKILSLLKQKFKKIFIHRYRKYRSKLKAQLHLKRFEKGGVKFQSKEMYLASKKLNKSGFGHPMSGTFVIPAEDFDWIMEETKGNPRELEKLLGLPNQYLGEEPVVISFLSMKNLRMPQGTEPGALPGYWKSGGFTQGGIAEAIVDPVPNGEYVVQELI